jgi:DNA repair exonuclease SbcCD nuclease subunit
MIERVSHPSKVNFTFITDIHLSARVPGRRRDNYRAAIMEKLELSRQLTEKVKGRCLCGGDVFHVKRPGSDANPHSLVRELIELIQKFPGGAWWGAVGNHDISQNNINTLPEQPLGTVIAAEVFKDLSAERAFFVNDEVAVAVDAFDYYEDSDIVIRNIMADEEPWPAKLDGLKKFRVAIVHASGNPGGSRDFFGHKTIGYDQLVGCGYDVMLWGHDHWRTETVEVGGCTHVNLGSLARAALSSDEVDRPVVVPVISFSTEGVKIVEKELPVKSLELAFTIEDNAVRKAEKSDEVKSFFEEVDDTVGEIETDDAREALKQLTDDQEVIDLIGEVCEL